MTTILHHDEAKPADPLGGKARALAVLGAAGFPVPPWFVLPPAAFEGDGSLSAGARAGLDQALARIAGGRPVAVRSSAMEEDGASHSFAGQFASFLSVAPADVPARARDVVLSARGEAVARYRAALGAEGAASAPAVLVQRMVEADAAGVAFGVDPAGGDGVLLSAVAGLGDRLVSGEAEGETLRVGSDGAVQREAGDAVLTDAQARRVAELARRAGAHFGAPQDVEWAIAGEDVFLLQSRPITALAQGELVVWDNSNIVESYRGITSPLTFSFARAAYEAVYRQFCRILRVPSSVIAANDATFAGMLGHIRGRVYYNLVNWYRVLAMLPGYRLNRAFMEQMMGVKEGLPAEVADRIAAENSGNRLVDAFHAGGSVLGLLVALARLKAGVRSFRRRVDVALASTDAALESMPADALVAHYRELQARLLTRWDAPLVNDFFCMIAYGVLSGLTESWCGSARLHDELLQGSGGMISAEPATRLAALAALARDAGLAAVLQEGTPDEIDAALRSARPLREACDAYLATFGERCFGELKLESPTLHDDPLPLYRVIGHLAASEARPAPAARHAPEARLDDALRGHPVRARIYRAVLRQARTRIRERENLRFERTRVFGRVRRIVRALGERLRAAGRLDTPDDVFQLEIETVLRAAGGDDADLRARVERARAAEARYRAMPPPPDRFETRGTVTEHSAPMAAPADELPDGDTARGLGCSPGVVCTTVRIVRDPRQSTLRKGEILVAESTDPGWILVFPLAAGIVVERGSPLSHSAIVARELGIPAVVSLHGATRWLKDGDTVEIDGIAGTVSRR